MGSFFSDEDPWAAFKQESVDSPAGLFLLYILRRPAPPDCLKYPRAPHLMYALFPQTLYEVKMKKVRKITESRVAAVLKEQGEREDDDGKLEAKVRSLILPDVLSAVQNTEARVFFDEVLQLLENRVFIYSTADAFETYFFSTAYHEWVEREAYLSGSKKKETEKFLAKEKEIEANDPNLAFRVVFLNKTVESWNKFLGMTGIIGYGVEIGLQVGRMYLSWREGSFLFVSPMESLNEEILGMVYSSVNHYSVKRKQLTKIAELCCNFAMTRTHTSRDKLTFNYSPYHFVLEAFKIVGYQLFCHKEDGPVYKLLEYIRTQNEMPMHVWSYGSDEPTAFGKCDSFAIYAEALQEKIDGVVNRGGRNVGVCKEEQMALKAVFRGRLYSLAKEIKAIKDEEKTPEKAKELKQKEEELKQKEEELKKMKTTKAPGIKFQDTDDGTLFPLTSHPFSTYASSAVKLK